MDPLLHVFILAGQSNMSGRGELLPEDLIEKQRVLVLDREGNFVPAAEPLHYIEPERTGTGPGMSFAFELANTLPEDHRIGLVPCAVGGSAIQQWLADENYRGVSLYSNLMKAAKNAAAKGILRAILWHQGESNTYGGRYADYLILLEEFFTRVRKDLGNPALPIIAGELGEFLDPAQYPMARQLNQELHELSEIIPEMQVVSAKGLGCLEDELHFDRSAVIELGKRMCGAYRALIKER